MSVLSGERLAAARAALDISQQTLSAHSGIGQPLISLWERDLKTPTEYTASKVQEALVKLRTIQQRCQQRYPGVKIDMNDIRFIRKELRKLDSDGKEIEQTWGAGAARTDSRPRNSE
jgi:transcriptional regulator with XRE-family HTH domain